MRARLITVATLAVMLVVAAPVAGAATISVNTTNDESSSTDGTCSLREAAKAADTDVASGAVPGECAAGDVSGNTITVPAGSYYLLGPLTINSVVSLIGSGAASTNITVAFQTGVLHVGAAAVASITGVTISGGHLQQGPTTGMPGGSGGGIQNAGTLTLTDTTVSGNRAGDGAPGGPSQVGGAGGAGGGIYNSGVLNLVRATVADNIAGAGGAGAPSGQHPGKPGGDGGGIANAAGATLSITDSSIVRNHAGAGGAASIGNPGGPGGAGGGGGGIWNAGTLSVIRSAITANIGGRGGDGGGPLPSTSDGGPGGVGGSGGGVDDASNVSQTISNSTIEGNSGGSGGLGTLRSSGGDGGSGGGVVSESAALGLLHVTLAGNQGGAAGGAGDGSPGAPGGGGGFTAFGSVTLQNSILAGNVPGNCLGAATDNGHNIGFPTDNLNCPATFMGGDPRLGTLQDNGGPTMTMALAAGSAAIDQVPSAGAACPQTDQRGVSRPQPAGGMCDIGAYEYAPPVCRRGAASTDAGKPVVATLRCVDPFGVAVTYALDALPGHGTLTAFDAAAGKVTYTPAPGYSGRDSFTYHGTSVNGTGASQAVSIAVRPPRRSPPTISNARLTNKRFRVAHQDTAISARKAPRGTSFRFTLSHAATLRIVITYDAPGLRSGRSCVAPSKKLRRSHAKHCTRTLQVGTLTRSNEPRGPDSVAFSGRIGHQALTPRSYNAVLSAANAGGRSKAVTLAFTVVG